MLVCTEIHNRSDASPLSLLSSIGATLSTRGKIDPLPSGADYAEEAGDQYGSKRKIDKGVQ